MSVIVWQLISNTVLLILVRDSAECSLVFFGSKHLSISLCELHFWDRFCTTESVLQNLFRSGSKTAPNVKIP